MAFSKLSKSFQSKKIRTSQEINQDYNENAVQYGHKFTMTQELTASIGALREQMAQHAARMIEIKEESKKVPIQQAQTQPAPAQTNEGVEEHA
jgi:hypothetical protein